MCRKTHYCRPCDIVDEDEAAGLTLNVSCVAYDSHEDVVTALVTWRLPSASTASKTAGGAATWNSTVLVEHYTPDGLMHWNAYRSSSHHVELSLAVNDVYIIAVRLYHIIIIIIIITRLTFVSLILLIDYCTKTLTENVFIALCCV